jgi:hydroxymethylpyrimidine pyrophosphatase-like HAD family hydrolase
MSDASDTAEARAAPAPLPPRATPRAAAIRLLALDVDGTVCDSRHEIADSTCAAIARVRAAGIRVVLATGRRYRDTLPVAARLGIDAPLVTASGALVKDPRSHATLERAAFDAEVLAGVLRLVVERGHEPILYSDSYVAGFDFHCRRLPHPARLRCGVDEYLDRNRALADVRPDLDRAPPAGIFAGFAMGAHGAMRDLEAALHSAWPDRLALHTIRSPRYRDWMCEIAPVGFTKWSGLVAVAGRLGIEPDAICAVGDDVNDLPMIRAAGLGIAMGNATADVRAAAAHVVGTHDDGGIDDVADLLLAGLAQTAPPADPNVG